MIPNNPAKAAMTLLEAVEESPELHEIYNYDAHRTEP